MPKKGSVAQPGVVAQAPGRGEMAMEPVSVCHQVSTIGHLPPPTTCSVLQQPQAHSDDSSLAHPFVATGLSFGYNRQAKGNKHVACPQNLLSKLQQARACLQQRAWNLAEGHQKLPDRSFTICRQRDSKRNPP